ncbi:MAG: hypothetical protein ABW352_14155 [Polyangiales bacterium]
MKSGIAIVLLGGLLASACDDGTLSSSASCRDYCTKLEVCDDTTDQAGCEAMCNAQRVRSESYLKIRAQCTDKLSCNVWQGEIGLMGEDICASGERCELNQCVDDGLYDLPKSTDQASYCSRVSSKLNACDRTLEVNTLTMHCSDLVGTLSTQYLDEMSGCIEADCAQVISCLKRAAGRYDTDLTMYPGSLAAASSP